MCVGRGPGYMALVIDDEGRAARRLLPVHALDMRVTLHTCATNWKHKLYCLYHSSFIR